ncbi:MAG: alpha/beta hydrolase [Actinomycetes bacterium]
MGLTSPFFLALCAVLAVGAPVATLLLWSRARGPLVARVLQRLSMIAACQVTAVVLLGVIVNNSFYFYSSWSDLLGGPTSSTTASSSSAAGSLLPASRQAEARRIVLGFHGHRTAGGGLVLAHTIHGAVSGISAPALIYLPREYAMPRYAHTRFPVVVVMPGYPGNPRMWLTRLPLPQLMRTEVDAHRAVPFVAVIIKETVAPPRDTECADVVGGPQVETFLANDVPSEISQVLRVRTDRAGWAFMGYSTGGFCAVKLAMRHPQTFASAVALSGFYKAVLDSTTGALYGGSTLLRDQSSPLWRLAHLPAPPIGVLATISKQEYTYPQTVELLKLARPPMQMTSIITPTGGHNTRNWSAVLPRAIDWLGHRFGPLGAAG